MKKEMGEGNGGERKKRGDGEREEEEACQKKVKKITLYLSFSDDRFLPSVLPVSLCDDRCKLTVCVASV